MTVNQKVLSPKIKSLAYISSIYLITNILNSAIPFALLPILTRAMSPEEYGQIAIFQTVISAMAAFIGLSVWGCATKIL